MKKVLLNPIDILLTHATFPSAIMETDFKRSTPHHNMYFEIEFCRRRGKQFAKKIKSEKVATTFLCTYPSLARAFAESVTYPYSTRATTP